MADQCTLPPKSRGRVSHEYYHLRYYPVRYTLAAHWGCLEMDHCAVGDPQGGGANQDTSEASKNGY